MKELLTSNWNGARIFRVALGIAVIIYAIVKHDSIMGWAGGFVLLMGISNSGCCGVGGCSIPKTSTKSKVSTEDTSFEEVK